MENLTNFYFHNQNVSFISVPILLGIKIIKNGSQIPIYSDLRLTTAKYATIPCSQSNGMGGAKLARGRCFYSMLNSTH